MPSVGQNLQPLAGTGKLISEKNIKLDGKVNPKTLNGFLHLDTTKCTEQDDIFFAGINLSVSVELFCFNHENSKNCLLYKLQSKDRFQ